MNHKSPTLLPMEVFIGFDWYFSGLFSMGILYQFIFSEKYIYDKQKADELRRKLQHGVTVRDAGGPCLVLMLHP